MLIVTFFFGSCLPSVSIRLCDLGGAPHPAPLGFGVGSSQLPSNPPLNPQRRVARTIVEDARQDYLGPEMVNNAVGGEDRRLFDGRDAILRLNLLTMATKMLFHRCSSVLACGSLVTPQLFCCMVETTTTSTKSYWAMAMRKAQVLVVTMNCVE